METSRREGKVENRSFKTVKEASAVCSKEICVKESDGKRTAGRKREESRLIKQLRVKKQERPKDEITHPVPV